MTVEMANTKPNSSASSVIRNTQLASISDSKNAEATTSKKHGVGSVLSAMGRLSGKDSKQQLENSGSSLSDSKITDSKKS